MPSDLMELKNLGNTSINWLRSIGVKNQQDLENMGAVNAYNEIKQRGIRVSKVLLYALHGAMTDTHWNDLNSDTKKHLLDQADERCSKDSH